MIASTPQKLIDDAVDEVFAEYDTRGKITTRVIANGDDEQLTSVEISFTGGLARVDEAFSEAEKAAEAVGAKSWTSVIYVSEDELVFIAVHVAGQKKLCILRIERKNGEAMSDLVLIPYLGMDDGEVLSLCAPTEWLGPTANLGITKIATILAFSKGQSVH